MKKFLSLFGSISLVASMGTSISSCSSISYDQFDISTITDDEMNDYLSEIPDNKILPMIDYKFSSDEWLKQITTEFQVKIQSGTRDKGISFDHSHLAAKFISKPTTDFWRYPLIELYGTNDNVIGTRQVLLIPSSYKTLQDKNILDLTGTTRGEYYSSDLKEIDEKLRTHVGPISDAGNDILFKVQLTIAHLLYYCYGVSIAVDPNNLNSFIMPKIYARIDNTCELSFTLLKGPIGLTNSEFTFIYSYWY